MTIQELEVTMKYYVAGEETHRKRRVVLHPDFAPMAWGKISGGRVAEVQGRGVLDLRRTPGGGCVIFPEEPIGPEEAVRYYLTVV